MKRLYLLSNTLLVLNQTYQMQNQVVNGIARNFSVGCQKMYLDCNCNICLCVY